MSGAGVVLAGRRSLAGSGIAVLVARVFSLACAAIQLPVLARVLPSAEYASVAVVIALATYFSLLAAEPHILPFQRFPGSNISRRNYAYASQRTGLYVAVLAILVIGVSALADSLELGAAIAGWGAGVAAARLVSTSWLMWGKAWQYSLNLVIGTGTRTAVLVLLVVLGQNALVSLAIAGLLSAAATYVLSPRFKAFQRYRRTPTLKWSFGVNLAVASFAFTVLTNASLIILTVFVKAGPLARFAAMTQVSALTSSAVIGLILTVMYPRLRAMWDSGARKRVSRELEGLKTGCLVIACVTIAGALAADHFALRIAVGSRLVDGAIFPALVMATAFAGMGQLSSWYHQLTVDAATIAFRTAVAASLGLISAFGLSAIWGERGAALGTAVGFFLYFVLISLGTRGSTASVVFASAALIAVSIPLVFPAQTEVASTLGALIFCLILGIFIVRGVQVASRI